MGWRGGLRGTAEAGQSGNGWDAWRVRERIGARRVCEQLRSEGERVRLAARVDRGGVLDRDGV